MVPELSRHRPDKIGQSINVVYVFDVGPVKNVEEFNASLCLETFREGNDPLQTKISVVVRISFVAVARTDADAVRKWKYIAVGVETRIDGETARALQTAENRKLKIPCQKRPRCGGFGQQ